VVGYASLFQECQELLLERHLLMMLALIADEPPVRSSSITFDQVRTRRFFQG
jgi:hypothetical protein